MFPSETGPPDQMLCLAGLAGEVWAATGHRCGSVPDYAEITIAGVGGEDLQADCTVLLEAGNGLLNAGFCSSQQ